MVLRSLPVLVLAASGADGDILARLAYPELDESLLRSTDLTPEGLDQALEELAITSEDVFCDLASGVGRAVFQALSLGSAAPAEARGLESYGPRHKAAEQAMDRLRAAAAESGVDFSRRHSLRRGTAEDVEDGYIARCTRVLLTHGGLSQLGLQRLADVLGKPAASGRPRRVVSFIQMPGWRELEGSVQFRRERMQARKGPVTMNIYYVGGSGGGGQTWRARFVNDAPQLPDPPDPDGALAAALRLVEGLYEKDGPAQARKVSRQDADAARRGIIDAQGSLKTTVYGEILPLTFIKLLHDVGVRAGQRYYDIGSGTGKTPLLAWLFGLDAAGVEIVADRWDSSCGALEAVRLLRAEAGADGWRVSPGARLRHLRAGFLEVDFSDADVLFSNNLLFSPEMLRDMARLAEGLAPGTVIVSVRPLEAPGIRLLRKVMGPASWSHEVVWYVQTVDRSPAAGRWVGASQPLGEAYVCQLHADPAQSIEL